MLDLGDGLAVAFKVESHNHPSAVEPFQGAATGVGGILRDIIAMGERAAGRVEQALRGEPDVLLGGSPIVARQVDAIVARDLKRAEMIAFPLVFLLSLWVFRGFVAALLPPLIGAIAIAGAFLGLRLEAEATTLSV